MCAWTHDTCNLATLLAIVPGVLNFFQLKQDDWEIDVHVKSHIIDDSSKNFSSTSEEDNILYVEFITFAGTSNAIPKGSSTASYLRKAINKDLENSIQAALGK